MEGAAVQECGWGERSMPSLNMLRCSWATVALALNQTKRGHKDNSL